MSLTDYKAMQERCSNCLGCKWIPFDKVQSMRFGENCPSVCHYNFNTYSARGRFQMGLGMVNGELETTDSVAEIIHSCTACGACDVSCKITRYNLEPLAHNLAQKQEAVKAGKVLPGQQEIMDSLAAEQTMLRGMKKADRLNWAEGLNLKDLMKETGEVAFFPGCKYSYEPALRQAARDAVCLLRDAGVDVGILGAADNCCGGRALQMGFGDAFEARAEANVKAIRAAGVKTIVTPCADCRHAFANGYAELGLDVEVLHVVEYLDRLVQTGRLVFTKSVPTTVTYHDPCHLGRLGEPHVAWKGEDRKILNQVHVYEPKRPRNNGVYGIYDAPRRLLAAIPGVTLVEMERIREYSWCCGAGGGCSETLPEFSAWTAGERIHEARATGADALVTACPWCETNFTGAKDENGDGMRVVDIIALVRQAM